ncbi:MAG: hypothetical protein CME27_02620 [Gemmatimonadetes bacterium]|nr:hypothetical protein [Gemmatimonadota bacterium]
MKTGAQRTRSATHFMSWQMFAGLAFVALLEGCDRAEFQPVRFSPVSEELFDEGGALTDAWADIDLDGDPDRFVGFNGTPSRLYRNDGIDGFVEIAAEVGLMTKRSVRTSAWGDFDSDGDPDLLLGYSGEEPVIALWKNNGATFTEVSEMVGLRIVSGTTRQAAWVDVDADGDLDLFLAMRDGPNHLFIQTAGKFKNEAHNLGLNDTRRTVGALWFDDGDGWLDVIVTNMNGDANGLYLGSEAGFTESQEEEIHGGGRALGDESQGSVRPCSVDYDADGDFDLFFANYGPNGLLERTPDGWLNRANEVGVANPSRYDTCAWADFDHDGSVDLFVNGTVGGEVHYRDWLMRREGDIKFIDVTPLEILERNASHGATWVDYDLDGDLDLALAGSAIDGTHALLENLLRPEFAWHSLQVRVLDEKGHSTRPGSEVRLFVSGTDRLLGTRRVDSGSGYDAQSDLPVHFGVPGGQKVDVEITVPGGGRRRVTRIDGVDPRMYQGRSLEVRTDHR